MFKAANAEWPLIFASQLLRLLLKLFLVFDYFTYESKVFDHQGGIYVDFERDTLVFGGPNREENLRTLFKSTNSAQGRVFASLSEPLSTRTDDITNLVRKIAIRMPPKIFVVEEVLARMLNLEQISFAHEFVPRMIWPETFLNSNPFKQKLAN